MENNQIQLPQTPPQPPTTTSDGLVAYNLDGNVFLPKNTRYLGVMLTDWNRLKKMISQCQSVPDYKFSNIAYTLYGVAGSAFVSLVSTLAAKPFGDHDTFISVILFLVMIVAIGGGYICVKFQNKETEHNTTSLKNVSEEMQTIEETSHLKSE